MAFPHWILLLVLTTLAGCGGGEAEKEPPPPPTLVNVSILATVDINPDGLDRPSPVVFRVFELKDVANFESADFFALYEKASDTLGGDLVRKQEFILVPGEVKTLHFKAEDETRFLAVFAAFRNLEAARWRAHAEIPRTMTTDVNVRVEGTRLTLNATQKPSAVETVEKKDD